MTTQQKFTIKVMSIRNRILDHRRVRAGDLVPHESNWRLHPSEQREALEAILAEVGFARSLLAYQLPDGRLKLIDGHLRREMHPDEIVDVEVLDVDDADARKLLLSLDSMAALATADADVVESLRRQTTTDSAALADLWESLDRADRETQEALHDAAADAGEQFLLLITCRDEGQQTELLERFLAEGLKCKALVS